LLKTMCPVPARPDAGFDRDEIAHVPRFKTLSGSALVNQER